MKGFLLIQMMEKGDYGGDNSIDGKIGVCFQWIESLKRKGVVWRT
jgi:hypothetical protein